jgi:thiosulfate dehydrogenase
MKRVLFSVLFALVLILVGTSLASAHEVIQTQHPDLVEGAQIYDSWYASLNVTAPSFNMPIWSRQSTNSRSGPDTWRCSECHGWDYKGVQGEYAFGSHKTGFLGVMASASNLSQDEIVNLLKGSKDPAHDFSKYVNDASLQKVALFIKQGLIDDSQFIDSVSLKVINGNTDHGRQLYTSTCAQCHGDDGKKIVFHTEGVNEYLGSVANRDPFRFLHRTRFGVAGASVAGTPMAIGYELGWKPADGRDVLAYAQTLPTGPATSPVAPASQSSQPIPLIGGPGNNLLNGILTAIGAFLATVGSSVLFLSIIVLIGIAVVLVLRRRK